MKQNEADTRRTTASIAFVIPFAMVRGVLTAIFWLQPLACPHLVAATLDEGMRWARTKLASKGTSLHPQGSPPGSGPGSR